MRMALLEIVTGLSVWSFATAAFGATTQQWKCSQQSNPNPQCYSYIRMQTTVRLTPVPAQSPVVLPSILLPDLAYTVLGVPEAINANMRKTPPLISELCVGNSGKAFQVVTSAHLALKDSVTNKVVDGTEILYFIDNHTCK